MHRTYSVARLFGRWSLLVALALHFGIQSASAQAPLPPLFSGPGSTSTPSAPVVELAVGMSRPWQMISRADLKRVENPNSRVVRVERMADRNDEILLVAENPGRTQITFTDQSDRVEVHDIIVTGGVQEQGEIERMEIAKGTFVTKTLAKIPLGGSEATVGNIVDVIPAKNNPRQFSIMGRNAGATRLTFYADAKKTEVVAAYDITVVGIDKVSQLQDMIRRIAPTAAVNVVPVMKTEDGGEVTSIILTGTVTHIQDSRMIEEAARRLFLPVQIGQQAAGLGTNTAILQFNVINQIRVAGVHTVSMEVVVAIVNRSELRSMSFSWLHASNNWFIASLIGGPGSLASGLVFPPSAMDLAGSGGNIPFGVLNSNGGTIGFLQALRTEGLVKVLAEPRVVTLSGRPANILSGGEVPLLTSSGIGGPTVTYKQFGTVVNALPIVMGNNKIYLEVKAEISNKDDSLGITIPGVTPTIVTGFRARSAQVAIQVEDGQTLAIGGLIQNDITASISRIPFLGDLPLLGAAFSQKTFAETEQELVILVTPRLVDPVDCTRIPKFLPGRETRSADDFEFFLEGILEAPRGQRNVIFHPHYYRAAYQYSPNAGQVPCGDANCGNGSGCATGNCGPRYSILGGSHGMSSPMAGAPAPGVQAVPVSNNRTTIEPELPPTTPAMREIHSPAYPSAPTQPRQLENRPLLPPIAR